MLAAVKKNLTFPLDAEKAHPWHMGCTVSKQWPARLWEDYSIKLLHELHNPNLFTTDPDNSSEVNGEFVVTM